MKLRINGEDTECGDIHTLAEVLCVIGLSSSPSGIAVARNGRVVPRSQLEQTAVQDGDRIEIVKAVQGG